MYSSCVLCDSEKDSECYELSDSKNFTKECQGTYTYSKRGCYTFRQSMQITAKDFQLLLMNSFFLFEI